MLHHFRFIVPLLQHDEDKISPLHYYDAAIQIARISEREPTEEEFYIGMQAAEDIVRWYVLACGLLHAVFHESLVLPALKCAGRIEPRMPPLVNPDKS